VIPAPEEKRRAYRASKWWGDKTLNAMFRENAVRAPSRLAAADAPNRAAFSFGDPKRWSYAELAAEVDRLSSVLAERGVGKDDIVLVQMPNIVEILALYFACAEIGAIISPIAVQYREHELREISKILNAKTFVCCTRSGSGNHIAAARAALPAGTVLFTFGPDAPPESVDLSSAQTGRNAGKLYRDVHSAGADDIFSICWTSGTTGAPKGVPRSHNHWAAIGPITHQAARLSDGDVILNPFPLINMAGIGGVIMSWLLSTGSLILHHPFDLSVFIKQIADEKPAFTVAPPAVLNMILKDEALSAHLDLSSVRTIGSGSAPLTPGMVSGFQERFGVAIVNLFGSNEGVSLASGPDDVPDPAERAAYFPSTSRFSSLYGAEGGHMNLRIVDPQTRVKIVEDLRVGELEIQGPTVFEGYFEALEQTQAAFTEDGWYRTGDLFQFVDNGRLLKFVGRNKDLIIRGGMKISPEEIDQLLSGHPNLLEACAFSVPDPIMGERVGVAIVPKDGVPVTLEQVVDFLKTRGVAVFKLPERIFTIGPLPRNALNKVLRHEVRRRALRLPSTD